MKMLSLRGLGICFFVPLLVVLLACQKSEVLSPEPSALDLDRIPPNCPGLKTLTVASGPALSFTWGEGTDELTQTSKISYSIFLKTGSGNYDLISPSKIVVGGTSTLVTSGIQLGQTYTAYVTCKDEAGNSAPAGPLKELSITVTDSISPSDIADLVSSSTSFTSTFLSWTASDDGQGGTATGQMRYQIYYGNTANVTTASPLLTTVTGSTSYQAAGLTPNTPYYFRITAMDLVGNTSNLSNEIQVSTLADIAPPAFTSNSQVAVTAKTTTSINLTWTNVAVTDNVTTSPQMRYRIYRCQGTTTCNPLAGTLINTTAANASTYTDTSLAASTAYVYLIRALDSSNNESTNTDSLVTSTDYSNNGYTYAYPTMSEVNQMMGQGLAVANVTGDATGPNAWPDLILGSPNDSEDGAAYRQVGCISVFAGTGPGQFSSTPTQKICQPSPSADGGSNRNFGYSVAVGNFDADADNTSDLLISAPNINKLYFYFTVKNGTQLSLNTTPQTITDAGGGTQLGYGLCVGDLDGSGGVDFAVTRSAANCTDACGFTGTGVLDIYLNSSAAGSFVLPSVTTTITDTTTKLKSAPYNWVFANNEQVVRSCVIGQFDSAVPTQNQIVIGSGSISPVSTTPVTGAISFYRQTGSSTFVFQNAIQAPGPANNGAGWGNSLAAGQIDGTGAMELAVGAPTDPTVGASAGGVYTYSVGVTTSNFTISDTGEAYYGGTDLDNNGMGSAVVMADLFNRGNHQQDLIAGASMDDGTMNLGSSALNIGKAFVYKNNSGSISSAPLQSDFSNSTKSTLTAANYGSALCMGDVNNDGKPDVIVGSMGQIYDPVAMTNNANTGAVYIYKGTASGEIDFLNPTQTITAPGSSTSGFGSGCVVMDFNNDGANDLVIGAPYRTVSGNGNRGAVYVYYGATAANLPATASVTINGPVAQANSYFGWSVTKGDLDNSGKDDLIVGATGVNSTTTNAGRAYVYWASDTTGLILTGSPTAINPPSGAYNSVTQPLANTQTALNGMRFGYSLAVFPTVAGSTGKDLVVCAPLNTVYTSHLGVSIPASNQANIGQCFIYEGLTNGGLTGSYQMMSVPRNEIRYPYQLTSTTTISNPTYFGGGMTVGDWDADGIDDLVVCATRQYNQTTLQANNGGCYQYKGKSGGGFQSSYGYQSNAGGTRNVPAATKLYLNPRPDGPSLPSEFGRGVLLMDVNNNTSLDLLVGEWLTDSPTANPKPGMGNGSGRILILRGGYND